MQCLDRNCRRQAHYFGRWTGGGLCLTHVEKFVAEHGISQLHADSRDRLIKARADEAERKGKKTADSKRA